LLRTNFATAVCLSTKTSKNPHLTARHDSCFANRVQNNPGNAKLSVVSLIVMATFGLAAIGCSSQGESSSPASTPSTMPSPAPPRYGMSRDRATMALLRLRPAFSGNANVYVSPSIIPTAFSWNDGTIYLSSGLLRILDDDEVTAAVAHELGHLVLGAGALAGQAHALNGSHEDAEQAADAVAIDILRRSGVPPASLGRVLAIVRDAPQTRAELRAAITRRIDLLRGE
jgi:hypothetical protein